jgi:hypothetical protein
MLRTSRQNPIRRATLDSLLPHMGGSGLMALLKLTLTRPDPQGNSDVYVNVDENIILTRSEGGTIVDAPTDAVQFEQAGSGTGSLDALDFVERGRRVRVEVVETPEEIASRAPNRKPEIRP